MLHKRYVDPKVASHLNGVAGISDADQLAQALRESTYFRATLADHQLTQAASEIAFASKFREA